MKKLNATEVEKLAPKAKVRWGRGMTPENVGLYKSLRELKIGEGLGFDEGKIPKLVERGAGLVNQYFRKFEEGAYLFGLRHFEGGIIIVRLK